MKVGIEAKLFCDEIVEGNREIIKKYRAEIPKLERKRKREEMEWLGNPTDAETTAKAFHARILLDREIDRMKSHIVWLKKDIKKKEAILKGEENGK